MRRLVLPLLAVLSLSIPFSAHSEDPPRKKISFTPVRRDIVKPENQADARHRGLDALQNSKPEPPPYLTTSYKKGPIILGPNDTYDAMFNPATWWAFDRKTGEVNYFMIPRAEKDFPTEAWKKKSYLPILISKDGMTDWEVYQSEPMFKAGDWYDEAGGTEDGRYADLRLQPYLDTLTGKTYDGAIMYTAYDGKTARIGAVFFNHESPGQTLKKGLIFKDEDVIKNPLVPGNPAWNKSMAMVQFKDPSTGKIRNIYYFGEGNMHHGGIMAMESDLPFSSQKDGSFGLQFPINRKPVIVGTRGHYSQGLVESAHQPIITRLTPELRAQTGEEFAIILSFHGDTPPWGYAVGWAAFSIKDPSGPPLYISKQPYLFPSKNVEKLVNVQVNKVIFNSAINVGPDGRVITYFGEGDTVIGTAVSQLVAPRAGDPQFTYSDCIKAMMKP